MNPITVLSAAPPGPPGRFRALVAAVRCVPARIRHGRPGILALRTLAAITIADAAAHSGAGPAPITGTLTGIAVWYALGARGDLAPPERDEP